MSEREKEILEKLNEAWPYISAIDKGYMLCMAEKGIDTGKEEEKAKEQACMN